MAMYGTLSPSVVVASPTSKMATASGWFSAAAARASRSTRASASVRSVETRSTFSATARRRRVSYAR
jgi:hypothetical protein